MELEEAKRILTEEVANICDEELSKALEVVLRELNKYEIETASKIANRVNEMSVQEMQEFLKPYTLYEKIIGTQNKKIAQFREKIEHKIKQVQMSNAYSPVN